MHERQQTLAEKIEVVAEVHARGWSLTEGGKEPADPPNDADGLPRWQGDATLDENSSPQSVLRLARPNLGLTFNVLAVALNDPLGDVVHYTRVDGVVGRNARRRLEKQRENGAPLWNSGFFKHRLEDRQHLVQLFRETERDGS